MKSFILFLASAASVSGASAKTIDVKVVGGLCGGETVVHRQQKGPFAALTTCEDAQGKYLTVMYFGRMVDEPHTSWQMNARTWSDPQWNSGVTSLAWAGDKWLYVANDGAYGNAGIYKLDLQRKTFEVVLKAPPGFDGIYTIREFKSGNLIIEIEPGPGKITIQKIKVESK